MNETIRTLLEEKVNDIFLEMQTKLDINDGGISPLMSLKLDESMDALTEAIENALKEQLENN